MANTTLRKDVDRRYHLGVEGELSKRGRNNTALGIFRGRPWAVRHITLEMTYTNSVMRTWKGDEKRDTIDMVGCTAKECDPSAVNGKKYCIEVLFRWGEVFIMQCLSNGSMEGNAEAENERQKWIHALNVAGRPPTAIDAAVENMKIHVLSFEHENCVYDYMKYKISNKAKLDDLLTATGSFIRSSDGQRDSQATSGKSLHATRPESEMVEDVEAWIDYLEQAFPCLYRSASEQADIEEFHKDELDRTMATHEHERNDTLASHGDEKMVNSRYYLKVLTDKVAYARAKEQRFFEEVENLVQQYSSKR